MSYLDSLFNYLVVSAPYLLFGLFASGLIHSFISVELIKKWLGARRFRDIFIASAVGVPLPLCSCSVIPTAVTLKKSGASNAATSAFLISTPESGVDSMIMTYGLIDWPMTIIRPIAAFVSAFFAGVLQYFFNQDEKQFKEEEAASCCHKDHKEKPTFMSGMKYAFHDLINDLALWLTVGILLGALIDYMVPADFFSTLSQWQSKGMILLIGVPLYICASATTPIAASLIVKGLSPGTALLLLLVGPATNFSNIAVLQKYIGKKGVVLNVFSIVVVALVFSYITDYLYNHFFEVHVNLKSVMHHHSTASWWELASVVILVFLLLKGIYLEEIAQRIHSHRGHQH